VIGTKNVLDNVGFVWHIGRTNIPENKMALASASYKKIKSKRIFEEVIEQIRLQIVNGAIQPGDRLPPERTLAELIGVHRNSIREALKILEYMGVVESKPGAGTILSDSGKDILKEKVSSIIRFSPRRFLIELIELREALEPHMAALAAKRATPEDLESMQAAIHDLKQEVSQAGELSSADERLHLAIAKATHNATFLRLTEPVMAMLSEFRERSQRIPGRRPEVFREHERIYLAIRDRHPQAARAAMKTHLNRIRLMLKHFPEEEE
jgi:GntR family transcriptional repressor for pyruvate dehydrogenase complex